MQKKAEVLEKDRGLSLLLSILVNPEFLQMSPMSMTCAPFHIHDKNMFLNQYCISPLAAAHLSFCVLILSIRNVPVIFFSMFYLSFNPNALRHLSFYSFKLLWPIIVNYKANRHLSVCVLFDFWVAFHMMDFHHTHISHTHTTHTAFLHHYHSAVYSSHSTNLQSVYILVYINTLISIQKYILVAFKLQHKPESLWGAY